MGSLSSRPKVPASTTQPVIYTIQQPASTASAVTESAAETGDSVSTESAAAARENNLLSRSRGRLATISTGFRGILNQSVEQNQRKTLLGE